MSKNDPFSARRRFLRSLGASAGLALFDTRGLFAQALALKPTASTTEGPFYPDKMPLDTDNDLLTINDAITPAVGQISHLTGRVLTATGQPIRNAFVAIGSLREHFHTTASEQVTLLAGFAPADDCLSGGDLEAPEPGCEAPQPPAIQCGERTCLLE